MDHTKFREHCFGTYKELGDYVRGSNGVSTVVQIVFDAANGKWLLFYLIA